MIQIRGHEPATEGFEIRIWDQWRERMRMGNGNNFRDLRFFICFDL